MGRRLTRSGIGRAIAGLLLITGGLAADQLSPIAAEASASYPPLANVIDIEAGGDFACAIVNEDTSASSGSVWCWGDNSKGQLGIDDASIATSPVARQVASVQNGFSNTDVSLISLGTTHACAVEAGELYCWGSNEFGKAGVTRASGGYDAVDTVSAPTLVAKPAGVSSGVSSWEALALASHHSCALTTVTESSDPQNPIDTAGVIYCWGHGNYLGNGQFYNLDLVECGSCASIRTQLDTYYDSNDLNNPTPLALPGVDGSRSQFDRPSDGYPDVWNPDLGRRLFTGVSNSGFELIDAALTHTCATKGGGESGVYCWGRNVGDAIGFYSDLGLWQPASFTGKADKPLTGVFSTISQLAVNMNGFCIQMDTATTQDVTFCNGTQWNFNNHPYYLSGYQTGNDPGSAMTGIQLLAGDKTLGTGGASDATQSVNACGVYGGDIWCFSAKSFTDGEQIPQGEMPATGSVTAISLGGTGTNSLNDHYRCAVKADEAFCWGTNTSGRLGNNSATDSLTDPVQVLMFVPPPAAPTGLTATAGDGSVEITFTAGAATGTITNYEFTLDGGTTWTALSPADATSPITISTDAASDPLENGTSYTIAIRAVTTVAGDASTAVTATPVGAPEAPTAVTATAGNAQATVSWTAPTDNGGSAITGYTAQVAGNPSLSCTTTAATTCDITGLTNGTAYQFEVIATNAQGDSEASTASTAVTPAAPSTGGGSDNSTDNNTDSTTDNTNDSADNTADDSADSAATTSGEITTPESATTSDAIDDDAAAELTSDPGSGVLVVDGTAVTPTVNRINSPAANTPADQRTPEQVEEIRTAARSMVDGFNAVAGENSGITVTDSDTGAVVNGLLTNPDDDTAVEVPAERVLVMTTDDVAVMMVATDANNSPLELTDGSLQITNQGRMAVRLAGLPSSTAGEVVLLPGRIVLGTFTTAADGTMSGTITLPTDVAAGDYAIAVAVGTSRIGVGVKATPAAAVLPATGGNAPVSTALIVLGLGVLLTALRLRRQSLAQRVPGA